MIKVKECSKEDIPLIRTLSQSIWPVTYKEILSPEQIGYMMQMMYSELSLINQMENKHHQFIVIYDEDYPVGYASYSHDKKGRSIISRLHKIYIDPGRQGKGLGKQIVGYVKNNAQLSGAEILELNVNRKNPAIAFYKKIGFEIFREEKNDIGSGFIMDDYVMQMKLT